MMNIQMIYYSRGGHTEKIAEAMAQKLGIRATKFTPGMEKAEADLLFIGSGIYAGKFVPEFYDYLRSLDGNQVKRAALFITCLDGEVPNMPIVQTLKSKKIAVEDEIFSCKGQFLFFSRKHPDEKDAQNAAEFAARIAGRVTGDGAL